MLVQDCVVVQHPLLRPFLVMEESRQFVESSGDSSSGQRSRGTRRKKEKTFCERIVEEQEKRHLETN